MNDVQNQKIQTNFQLLVCWRRILKSYYTFNKFCHHNPWGIQKVIFLRTLYSLRIAAVFVCPNFKLNLDFKLSIKFNHTTRSDWSSTNIESCFLCLSDYLMENAGIEPATSCMQSTRSTNWANSPLKTKIATSNQSYHLYHHLSTWQPTLGIMIASWLVLLSLFIWANLYLTYQYTKQPFIHTASIMEATKAVLQQEIKLYWIVSWNVTVIFASSLSQL